MTGGGGIEDSLIGNEAPPDVIPREEATGGAPLTGPQSGSRPQDIGHIVSDIKPGIYRGFIGRRYDTLDGRPVAIPRQVFGIDENTERGNWTGQLDYLLSMLGYAVGLGNVWRFPYLCYRNGGGAFLVPYLLFMTFVGIPLFFMESALGQFTSSGPTTCWQFAPIFQGVGIAMMVSSFITSGYYCMIIAWCQFYFFASFTSDLPWSDCNGTWTTPDCSLKLPTVTCYDEGDVSQANGTCYNNGTLKGLWNYDVFHNMTGRRRISPSEEYWTQYVLGLSDGIEEMGAPQWRLVLCLLFSWALCFVCLIKGIKSAGRVVYFTATFPYLVLLVLFIRGVILEDAILGIKFYIVPDFRRLSDYHVWRDAAVQIFYSMGPAWGGLIALSSYNRFHNNVLRDSLIVSLGNCMTSIFGGFVIFSYIGHMAGQLNVPVKDVATDGAGLAFVVYPEAVRSLPLPALWSVIFFFMLITLGLDSEFATVEAILTGLLDLFPRYRPQKTIVIFIICVVFFLLGLPFTTHAGIYWVQLMDHYGAAWGALLIGLVEVIAVSHVYGVKRFCQDIEVMIGPWMTVFWVACWTVITPLGILLILGFSWALYVPVKYGDYVYPGWAEGIGWIVSFAAISCVPAFAIYKFITHPHGTTAIERLRALMRPTRDWGPALSQHRQLVHHVTGFVVRPADDDGDTEIDYVNRRFTRRGSVDDTGEAETEA